LIEHCELAEKLTLVKLRESDWFGVFIDDPNAHRTCFNDIKRIAFVVLVEDSVTSAVVYLVDPRCEPFELIGFEAFEKRDARKAFGFVTKGLVFGQRVFVHVTFS